MGERVVRADGTTASTATVAAVRAVAGTAAMWDLSVGQVHTFAVGAGRYVVHNCAKGVDYEDRVKAANGDPTIGENHSHRWDGSQPVTDARGNPIDRGLDGPDAVRDYGSPNETWIEATSNVSPGADVFGKDRKFNQLAKYEEWGRPFEFWFDGPPSDFTKQLIEDAGGKMVIFP